MKKRVVIIGLDGLSWNVLEKLFGHGIMNNLKRCTEKGVHSELRSTIPPFTIPTWVSLCTGVNPGKHGAYSFLMPNEDYGFKLTNSKDVKYPRIYEIFTMKGLKSIVINVPLSYPPLIFKGLLISDWLYPKFRVVPSESWQLVKDYTPPDPLWSKRDPLDYIERIHINLRKRLKVIRNLFSKQHWDLFFVVFSETDFLLHKMYKDIVLGTGLAKEAYEIFDMIDNFIGESVRLMSRDVIIMLVSDHGFTEYSHVVHVNKFLRDRGFVKLKVIKHKVYLLEKRNTSKRRILHLPKALYAALNKIEITRKVLSFQLRNKFNRYITFTYKTTIDRPSSVAFLHCPDHFGVYINSSDVFQNWLLKNKEAEVIQNVTKKFLTNVKNPKTGESIFEKVYLREELFHGPYVKKFPHVIFLPKKNYWIGRKATGETIEKKNQANHSLRGIFVVIGKDVNQEVKLSKTSIFDIVPTILHYCGFSIPHDTDGKVLQEIFDERSEIKNKPVRMVNYLRKWRKIQASKRINNKIQYKSV